MGLPITRIKPPKFRIGKNVLNEYELRHYLVEVAKGIREPGDTITGTDGGKSIITKDGYPDFPVKGMEINSEFTLEIVRIKREKNLFNFLDNHDNS